MSAAIAGKDVAMIVASMFSMNSATAMMRGTRRSRLMRGGAAVLEHDPENACPAPDAGWVPVSRLREALAPSFRVDQCFGGRRQVGKDHAPPIASFRRREHCAARIRS